MSITGNKRRRIQCATTDVGADAWIGDDLYVKDETRKLHEKTMAAKERISPDSSPEELVEVLKDLKDVINTFFDNVLVMCEEEDLRKARLALIQRIASLPDGIVDISLLEGF